jgi:hypothetical protein
MTEEFKVKIDFDQTVIRDDIIELLSNNLKEDLDRDSLKVTLKESLAIVAKGTPLQKGPANDLLTCILRTLSRVGVENREEEEEAEESTGSQDLGTDPTMTQVMGGSGNHPTDQSARKQKTKGELCRYYARGRCNRPQDCRFDHPGICKKFRQWGSISNSTKGCDGKCDNFHPNTCRSSLKDKTCSWTDCRFFHLKGTKKTTSKSNSNYITNTNPNSNSNANQDRHNQNGQRNGRGVRNLNQNWDRNGNNNRRGPNDESKNRFACLDNSDRSPAVPEPDPEKIKLNQTLEAIMRRLTDMETRQASYQPQVRGPAYLPATSYPSPVVQQPGTQTQRQWGSPNQWTQSQSQSQY